MPVSHQLLAEAEADEAGDGEGVAEFLALGFEQARKP